MINVPFQNVNHLSFASYEVVQDEYENSAETILAAAVTSTQVIWRRLRETCQRQQVARPPPPANNHYLGLPHLFTRQVHSSACFSTNDSIFYFKSDICWTLINPTYELAPELDRERLYL